MLALTEPKAFKDGVQFAFDSTSIKVAEECLRKYYYTMIEGWKSTSESVHLRFGGHYASAIEHFYKWKAEGMTHDEALLCAVKELMVETWDHDLDAEGNRVLDTGKPYEPPIDAPGSARMKTRENLLRTFIWYIEQFASDPAEPIILANGKPAVELSFALPVDDGIIFTGHMDRLTEYAGNIMGLDNKTTGSTITARYFEGFKPDIQMSMYTFAGKMIYQIPVRGMIIDAAQIAVGFSRFERGITMRTDSELQEFYDTTMATIARARHATEMEYFPMNRTACSNYGGCPFRRVCSKSPEVRTQFLKADFVQAERWDPLRAR
jgi:hypothetical protein